MGQRPNSGPISQPIQADRACSGFSAYIAPSALARSDCREVLSVMKTSFTIEFKSAKETCHSHTLDSDPKMSLQVEPKSSSSSTQVAKCTDEDKPAEKDKPTEDKYTFDTSLTVVPMVNEDPKPVLDVPTTCTSDVTKNTEPEPDVPIINQPTDAVVLDDLAERADTSEPLQTPLESGYAVGQEPIRTTNENVEIASSGPLTELEPLQESGTYGKSESLGEPEALHGLESLKQSDSLEGSADLEVSVALDELMALEESMALEDSMALEESAALEYSAALQESAALEEPESLENSKALGELAPFGETNFLEESEFPEDPEPLEESKAFAEPEIDFFKSLEESESGEEPELSEVLKPMVGNHEDEKEWEVINSTTEAIDWALIHGL